MRAIASSMETPVIILLLILVAASVFMIGWIIAELFTERKHLKEKMPALVDELNYAENNADIAKCIRNSLLLIRQKDALTELISHPDM